MFFRQLPHLVLFCSKYFFTCVCICQSVYLTLVYPVVNGISRVNPLITGVITHLPCGMSHQVVYTNAPIDLLLAYLWPAEILRYFAWASPEKQSNAYGQSPPILTLDYNLKPELVR